MRTVTTDHTLRFASFVNVGSMRRSGAHSRARRPPAAWYKQVTAKRAGRPGRPPAPAALARRRRGDLAHQRPTDPGPTRSHRQSGPVGTGASEFAGKPQCGPDADLASAASQAEPADQLAAVVGRRARAAGGWRHRRRRRVSGRARRPGPRRRRRRARAAPGPLAGHRADAGQYRAAGPPHCWPVSTGPPASTASGHHAPRDHDAARTSSARASSPTLRLSGRPTAAFQARPDGLRPPPCAPLGLGPPRDQAASALPFRPRRRTR